MSDDKKVTKMSPESRNRLVGLVNKTAEYVAEGLQPTEALAKAGSVEQYPPDYIYRAAESYNGAAHLQHFKSANYEARGDSFNLADGKEALTQILGARADTPKEAEYVDTVGDDRRYFEDLVPDRDKASSVSESVASITTKEALDNAERLRDTELRSIDKSTEKLSEIKDALRDTLRHAKYQVSISDPVHVNKIASEFLTINGVDAADIVSEVTAMSFDEAVKLAGFEFGISQPDDELFSTLEDCLLLKRAGSDTRYELGVKEADHYCNSSERAELIYEILGVQKKATPNFDFDSIPVEGYDLNQLPTKSAFIGSAMVAANTLNSFKGTNTPAKSTGDADEPAQVAGLKSLLDPAFIEEIQRIELAKKMQQVLRDPVIEASASNPQEIEEALQELTAIAPSAVNYTPLLRSMLRRRLESKDRIDQYDISQLLTTDQALKNRAQQ